jgi:hypothetical protein
VYPQEQVAESVTEHFVPVKIYIKERPQDFGRFKAEWTPTLILTEADGTERHRVVGFLPADDFLAQLYLGLAKAAFSRGQFVEAEAAFEMVVQPTSGDGCGTRSGLLGRRERIQTHRQPGVSEDGWR